MFAELPIAVALSSPNLRFAYYAASSGKAYLLLSLSIIERKSLVAAKPAYIPPRSMRTTRPPNASRHYSGSEGALAGLLRARKCCM